MDATLFVLLLTLIRLVIPVSLLLGLGELIKRRNENYWLRM